MADGRVTVGGQAVTTTPNTVAGHILVEYGLPAAGIPIRIYARGFGGVDTRLGEAITNAHGYYSLSYAPPARVVNLVLRTVDKAGKEVTLSNTKFGAASSLVINLVAPASVKPLAPEYERLTADIAKQINNIGRLGGAKENATQQDLTMLNVATGWDTRLIALAAMAMPLSRESGMSLDVVYSLLRAGLPSDKTALAMVSPDAVGRALTTAAAAGIVALSEKKIAAAKTAFQTFSLATLQAAKTPASVSTFGELLATSGLNADEQTAFAKAYFASARNGEGLWEKVKAQKIAPDKIHALQLQGKLAYLTMNNAPLVQMLQKDFGSASNLTTLVDHDLHEPDAWIARLHKLTGHDPKSLAAIIPPEYTDAKVEDRAAAYAGDLARRVRTSFPTHVVARMIDKGEVTVSRAAGAPTHAVSRLLRNAATLGFSLGRTPIDKFISSNKAAVYAGIDLADADHAAAGVKQVARMFQVTPSNESLKAATDIGFTSAHDITSVPEDRFMELYGARFPSTAEARLVYHKSLQVTTTVFNVFTGAKTLDTTPGLFAISGPSDDRQSAKDALISNYPTMASLFGSLDFCDCEECRSVLSPAAYLVDLLQFLDPHATNWQSFLADWRSKHNNAPYPFRDQQHFHDFSTEWTASHPAQPLPNTEKTPYEVLIERRPDLPNLPLTCENTNTVLPYIDIANEILEYFVVHHALAPDSGYDTGEVASAELIAEPQNILPPAYDALKQATYPPGLPFDLWNETVRRFLAHFDVELSDLLELYRPPAYASNTMTVGGAFAAGVALSVTLSPASGPPVVVAYTTRLADVNLIGVAASLGAAINASAAVTGASAFLQPATAAALAINLKALASGPSQNAVALAVSGVGVTLAAGSALFAGGDELLAPTSNANAYYRSNVFITALGLSPSEYAIFTDDATATHWFTLYGYDSTIAATAALSSAKTLANRLGVSYQELTDLVTTGFVNPKLDALVVLQKLGLDVRDVFRYENSPGYTPFSPDEHAAFEQTLTDAATTFPGFNATQWLGDAWHNGDFNAVLLLADPNTGCNFDNTTLQYADGSAADAIVFHKISLFVRIWRKLGWTMDEVDRALQTLVPASLVPLTLSNVGTAFKSVLLYLSHVKALDATLTVGANSRNKLLTLWARLPTTGQHSLYAQLFLTRSILKNDPVFDDPLGHYLSDNSVLLKDHLPAVQAAMNVSAVDIAGILDAAGQSLDTAVLSLDNVSVLYRHRLLASALGLSVAETIALTSLSGIDPFAALKSTPVAALADDYPFAQTLRFVEVATIVRASGFRIDDLEYLLRHEFDPVGTYKPDQNALVTLVKALAAGLRRIQSAEAVPADPTTVTDDDVQRHLALVLPSDAATTFMGMWTGTVLWHAEQSAVLQADHLVPAAFAGTPISVSYDAVTQTQALAYTGVLDAATSTQIQTTLAPGLSATSALVLNALLTAVQADEQAFYDKYCSAFLTLADYQSVTAPLSSALTTEQKRAAMLARRQTLLGRLLPYVQQQLTVQFVVQTLTSTLAADATLIQALTTDATLLADPTAPGAPLVDAFASTLAEQVDVTFYASTDGTGPALLAVTSAAADTASKPPTTRSAHIEGYFEVPSPGPYRFFVDLTNSGATAELRLDALPNPLVAGTAATNNAELSQVIRLSAGVPYHFTLDVRNLGGGDASLLVQGESLPKDNLAQLTLYATSAVNRTARAEVMLSKVLQYVTTFTLDTREIRYLLSEAADFDGFALGRLPTESADPAALPATTLFTQFLRAAAYVQLRSTMAGGTDDLIGIFENARLAYPASADATAAKGAMLADLCQRVADLTRRDLATVQSLATGLGYTARAWVDGAALTVIAPDFRQERGIQRLWNALQLVTKLGVPVDAPARWATPAPDFPVAEDLRNTVKAQYSTENWLAVAPTIFDKLRQRQRDALVAYIMQLSGFTNPNQLFEYFLVDPLMEPVVQTSRLRLAMSSLQTFIQRCLLNLEPEVQPSALSADAWQWMKRYRVWQANREIFLFPENLLDPAWRDDKTHLYLELEGKLLQGDVSNDLAEDAFFTYLKKLQEIARLEIVTLFCEQNALDPGSTILHLVGRTHSLPHKYFYRQYAHQMWTPWDPVGVELDGDHVVAVMWRGRLNLFWLTFLVKSHLDTSSTSQDVDFHTSFSIPMTIPTQEVQIQLNWSEYFQGQWTTRETSGFGPAYVMVDSTFDPGSVFVHGDVTTEDGVEVAYVNMRFTDAIDPMTGTPCPWDVAFRVVSRNSPPTLVGGSLADSPHDPPYSYSPGARRATHYVSDDFMSTANPLTVSWDDQFVSSPGTPIVAHHVTQSILQGVKSSYALTTLGTPIANIGTEQDIGTLIAPFFFQDPHAAFYVEPTLTETTVSDWVDWAIPMTPPNVMVEDPDWWRRIPVEAAVPELPLRIPPGDPVFDGTFDDGARFTVKPGIDWLTNDQTAIQFGDRLIGRAGSVDAGASGARILQRPDAMIGAATNSLGENLSLVGVNLVGGAGLASTRTPAAGAGARTAVNSFEGIGR